MITNTSSWSGPIIRMANLRAFTQITLVILLLYSLCISTFAQVRLVADLNPGKKDPFDAKPFSQNENDGGRAYFIGSNSELWTSDGTNAGTKFLKEFQEIRELEVIGDICYFSAGTSGHGIELWKSNGTAAGTVRVKDIVPGRGNSTPLSLTKMDDVLYFSANNIVNGRELWKSDGTASGTQLVKDIATGPVGSMPATILAEGDRIFFVATTEGPGYELWISDGSSEGTRLVKDIHPGAAGSNITELTPSNGLVFFSAQSPMRGRQLWRSDGTESGTSIVKVINTSGSALVSDLINVNGLIFFRATDGIHGLELFRSDGTSEGTFMLKDINRLLSGFSNISGKLFFVSYEYEWNTTDRNIWMSDGTPDGTVQLSSPGLYVSIWHKFHEINGAAYIFGFNRSLEQNGLYRFDLDGSLSFIDEASWSSEEPMAFVQIGDLHFAPVHGYYWRTDGTSRGTYPLRTLCCGAGSNPSSLEDVGGKLYFSTSNGEDFWRSQGTEETTELIEEDFVEEIEGLNGDVFYRLGDSFGPGSTVWKLDDETGVKTELSSVATDPRYITAAEDRVYFVADTPSGVRKMWVSDGTAEGTHAIDASPTPNFMAALGTRIIFHSYRDLWVSDGTESGTLLLASLRDLQYLTQFKGELYFYASDETHGLELWKTNGTPSGTVLVKDIRQNDTAGFSLQDLGGHAVAGEWFYFAGQNNEGEPAIWRTNGTAAGTAQFIAFEPIFERAFVSVISAGSNIFILRGVTSGVEIWRSDGTDVTKVTEVNEFFSNKIAVKGDVMYVITTSQRPELGRNDHIWRSDGTVGGTYQIRFRGHPYLLETSGDHVYLAGRADKEGYELFVIEESASVSAAREVVVAEIISREGEELVSNFPSPFTDGFTLRVAGEESSIFRMEVLTIDGKKVGEAELASNVQHYIPATAWTNGMYLMKIRTKTGSIIRKVLKQSH